jgi:uncharacterized protein
MRKLFIDTNIWLRYFLNDEKKQFEKVKSLISDIEAGKVRPYTSSIVILEITYVLKSVYKLKHEEVLDIVEAIKSVRGMTIIDRTDFDLAFRYYKKYRVKFTDCLIASQIPSGMDLVSYDEELTKIEEVSVVRP